MAGLRLVYDHLAGRWVVMQATFLASGRSVCVAVSATGDPTGPYHQYEFALGRPGTFADYPKIAVWPDGYYLSENHFPLRGLGFAVAAAFEREAVLAGEVAAVVWFKVPAAEGEKAISIQPSHLEGQAPAEGACNTFIMAMDTELDGIDGARDGYRLWDFCVDWQDGGHTLIQLANVDSLGEFDSVAFGVPQPPPGWLLTSLASVTMTSAVQRDFGTHRSLLVNHTVNVGFEETGIRWVELRDDGSGWFLHQEGVYAPADHLYRFMGSIAIDRAGNIALGYSVSSFDPPPSIRYTSRRADDPLGTMPGGEVEMVAGGGVQQGSLRWGDYSSMRVDDEDGCTFWYAQQYYPNTGLFDWSTAAGRFKFDDCGD